MTPERLAEIKARCEAATDGPWLDRGNCLEGQIEGYHLDFAQITTVGFDSEIALISSDQLATEQQVANGDFIAHARQDLPDCMAEIERLQGIEKALRDLYNDCRNEPCDAQRGAVMDQARKILETE